MTTKRFIIDDAGSLIDMRTRETYDYVSDVCLVLNELNDENEQLKQDVEYWKQVASQYSNELNVFEHSKRYKTECKDIYWSSDDK